MKRFFCAAFLCLILCIGAFAAATVYVDGTVSKSGDGLTPETAVKTLDEAIAAVDAGGKVILSGNLATPTKTNIQADKGFTLTSQNGAVLTLGRNFYLGGDTTIENIALVNGAATNSDCIYARGHDLTIGSGVTVKANASTGRYLILAAGQYSGDLCGSGTITVNSGTWRNIFSGNWNDAYTGTATVIMNGGTIFYVDDNNGCIKAGNIGSSSSNTSTVNVVINGGIVPSVRSGLKFTGSCSVTVTGGEVGSSAYDTTVDLRNGGSAMLGACAGKITTLAGEGYRVMVNGNVYSVSEIPAEAPEKIYVDGTLPSSGNGLTPETAVRTLTEAVMLLTNGGTVIVCGDTDVYSETTLPAYPAITVTSVDGDDDYTDIAAVNMKASLHLGGDTVFKDIVIESKLSTFKNIYIFAEGNKVTFDKGVACLNYMGTRSISVVGGTNTTPFTGDTHIVIRSGRFRNIYCGNLEADFNGNTHLEMTGGIADVTVAGGNYKGNFKGSATINFGGDASLMYGLAAPTGFVGGTVGASSGTVYTFDGDVDITITGKAGIGAALYGASRYAKVHHTGDVRITVSGSAYSSSKIFAAGNCERFTGNTTLTLDGGFLENSIYGGSSTGTMNGNAEIIINGGDYVYKGASTSSSNIPDFGTCNIYASGDASAALNGNASVMLNGGNIFGGIFGDAGNTVSGTKTVTVKGGTVYGSLGKGDVTVDLSNNASVKLCGSSEITNLIGGGKLTVLGTTKLAVGSLSGNVDFAINGVPLPIDYITADTVAPGSAVHYTPVGVETLAFANGVYAMDFEGAHRTTEVTVNFNAGWLCEVYEGQTLNSARSTPPVTPVSYDTMGETSATYTLAPGLYSALVRTSSKNFHRQYFYVYGDKAEQTVNVQFTEAVGDGYERLDTKRHNEEVLAAYYDNTKLEGFFTPDLPYFTDENRNPNIFTSHSECHAFIEKLTENCDYMYRFYLGESKNYGFDCPVVVFTKDEIPEGAALEEIAEIVQRKAGRDIILIDSAVHGNEPSGLDGSLAYMQLLAGEYGESLFDGTNIGAIIVIPMMSPEGSYTHTRDIKEDPLNANPNRQAYTTGSVGTATYAYVGGLFLPTVTVDMHEMTGRPNYDSTGILTDMYDVGINFLTQLHNPVNVDVDAALRGDRASVQDIDGEHRLYEAMDILESKGIRAYYYYKMKTPCCSQMYSANSYGSYDFIIESTAVQMGGLLHDRHVFMQVEALKALMQVVLNSNGSITANVLAGREQIKRSAQQYSDRTPIVVSHGRSRSIDSSSPWNNPLVHADGSMITGQNTVRWHSPDVADRYRTRPTAYAFSADVEHLGEILGILARTGIGYKKFAAGTTLTLQRYGGTASDPTLGENAAVTFANGVYVVPVDGYAANAICLLFEPDNGDSVGDDAGNTTLVQCGLLANADIYRSTESFIAAKMGIKGTYKALDIPNGKTVASATVDGKPYDSVAAEDGQAFVLATDKPYYTVSLFFSDGSSKEYYIGSRIGDMNGDLALDLGDALLLLRGILNEDVSTEAGDVNGDGNCNLLDVITLLKTVAR